MALTLASVMVGSSECRWFTETFIWIWKELTSHGHLHCSFPVCSMPAHVKGRNLSLPTDWFGQTYHAEWMNCNEKPVKSVFSSKSGTLLFDVITEHKMKLWIQWLFCVALCLNHWPNNWLPLQSNSMRLIKANKSDSHLSALYKHLLQLN